MNRQRGVGFGRHAKARVFVAEDSAGDRRPRGGRDAEDPSGIRRPGSVTSAQGQGSAGNAAHPRGLSPAVRRSRAAPGTRARSRESHARGGALTPRARPPVLQVWAARTPHPPLGRGWSGPAPPGKALGTPGKGLSGGRSPGARAAGLRGGPSPSPPRQQIGHMTDSVKWGFLAAPTPGMK